MQVPYHNSLLFLMLSLSLLLPLPLTLPLMLPLLILPILLQCQEMARLSFASPEEAPGVRLL